jgi:hypothetical protein
MPQKSVPITPGWCTYLRSATHRDPDKGRLMAHEHLLADNSREFFQTSKLIELVISHPLLALIGTLGILTAYGCSEIATRKNRNDRLWATLGLLFSVVPLIALLALPSIEQTARLGDRARA